MSKQEQGFVSIIVAAILMVLMSVVTIGFSRAMQREQRQSLDRQLSSQAFYAAETAINDTYNKIIKDGSVAPIDSCDPSDLPNKGIIDKDEPDVAFTCLRIDPSPSSLEFDNGKIATTESKVFPLSSKSGSAFSDIKIEWAGEGGNDFVTNCTGDLPVSGSSTALPILRFDMTALSNQAGVGVSTSRASINNNSKTFFFSPVNVSDSCSSGKTSIPFATTDKGIVKVICDPAKDYPCSITLNFPSTLKTSISPDTYGSDPANYYLVRAKAIYNNANMKITGNTPSGEAKFIEAQTVVDATGRANDVLRRIQMRLSNYKDFPVPEGSFQGFSGFCKLLEVAPAAVPDITNVPCS